MVDLWTLVDNSICGDGQVSTWVWIWSLLLTIGIYQLNEVWILQEPMNMKLYYPITKKDTFTIVLGMVSHKMSMIKNLKLDFFINFMLWTRNFLWNVQMFKYSRGTFSMISIHTKFFSVFEIFPTKLSEKSVLGIRNVTFWLFFNNKHLRFCCQIITYGHHLSKKIITSQFSQFSFLGWIWRFGPYFSYMT